MGVLDFVKGAGEALKTGLTKIGDTTIGIGKDLGGSAYTLGKMGAYASDAHHWDDIASATGKGVEFIAEHPAEAAKIGGTIAKKVAIDSVTTPSGILTTGLALASGGAGLVGKFAEAGKIAKGVSEVGEVGKVVEGVSAGAKGAKALEAASEVGEAGKVAKVSTLDKLLGAGVKVNESGALERSAFAKARDPLNWASKGRTAAAEKIMAGAGEEAPSIGRQVLAGMVQGTSGAKSPTRLAGMSDEVQGALDSVWRVRQAGSKLSSAPNARKALSVAANPRKAVFDAATSPQGKELAHEVVQSQIQKTFKQFEQPGTGQQVMDFGQEKPAGYGGPGEQLELPLEYPKPATQGTATQGTFQPLEQPKDTRVASSRPADQKQQPLQPMSTSTTATSTSGGTAKGTAKAPLRGRKTMHAWQGQGREAFGGITPGFDWRDRNWGIERPHRNLSFANGAKFAQGDTSEEETTVSQGQQPAGSPEPNIKPVEFGDPFENMGVQFPTLKVTPGSTLKQPKQQVLGV